MRTDNFNEFATMKNRLFRVETDRINSYNEYLREYNGRANADPVMPVEQMRRYMAERSSELFGRNDTILRGGSMIGKRIGGPQSLYDHPLAQTSMAAHH